MERNFGSARSIANHPQRAVIETLLNAALDAADPRQAVRGALALSEDQLKVGGRDYNLAQFERVFIVGAGKAAVGMVQGAVDVLGERVSGGVVIVKHLVGSSDPAAGGDFPPGLRFLQGGHPLPDERSVYSTRQVIALLEQCTARDLVLCLISGGGSALMTYPVAGVGLSDLQALTALLLGCGADIGEINTLRKHLDRIKGGGLAHFACPAALVTLILSDVIGSPLDVIASGPTVADPSTYQDALAILRRYQLEKQTPPAILSFLIAGAAGQHPESVKAGEACLLNTCHQVVASNAQAAARALEAARAQGLQALLLTTYLRGEAREAGLVLASILRETAASGNPLGRPVCLVVGGETTVTLRGKGTGGRNTELALGAVRELAGLEAVILVSLATDGEDGPTDAAGAVVTGETFQRGCLLGLAPDEYLRENDSYAYFAGLGDLLRIGPTGTNVNDLAFLFAFQPPGQPYNRK